MKVIQAAIYARVSSEQQAAAHTIESQLAVLSERAQNDGVPVLAERLFVDDRYSGSTLVRPALDRLRDLATTVRSTASTSIRPTDSHVTMPIRSS